jgi:hypothetical protein
MNTRDWQVVNPVYDDVHSEEACSSWDFGLLLKASRIVSDYIREHLDKSDGVPPYFEVYVVWFSKTLGNWKALVSSTLPDGMYYEVTYNGEKKETYLDAYKKVQNVCIPD